MNEVGTEPMLLRIIKFQKYLQQCAINTPTKGEKHLYFLERYLPTMTTKESTTTRHSLCLQILEHQQFYQRNLLREHKQDHHRRYQPNTLIFYSNISTMYANTRRRKRSTRNTKQELWRYVTRLQPTLSDTLCQHTTTSSMGFVLSILLSLYTTSTKTMEMSYQNSYKRIRLHWTHNGTRLLPLQYYSLLLKTENIRQSWGISIHLEKYPLICIPCHKRHWIVQPDM